MHERSTTRERLLLVAHGTASAAGAATIRSLTIAAATARPDHVVDLCFLDVADPPLPDALDDRPTIVVPALLSTGYHVQTDIPAAVADHPRTRVARHLGPHPLLTDALADRLGGTAEGETIVLAASGSSRPAAADEVGEAARLLGERLGRDVHVVTVGPGLADGLAAVTGRLSVATYLLAEGTFYDGLRAAVGSRGRVAPPLGTHPAVMELIWRRYEALAGTR